MRERPCCSLDGRFHLASSFWEKSGRIDSYDLRVRAIDGPRHLIPTLSRKGERFTTVAETERPLARTARGFERMLGVVQAPVRRYTLEVAG
jgi:hypothetical protein